MQQSGCKTLTERFQQRKLTQQNQLKGCGARRALLISYLILSRLTKKQQEEGLGSLKGDTRKMLALAETGDPEQLLHGDTDDQEKQEKQEARGREGPGVTDTEDDKLLFAAKAANRGQLWTAARLSRGSKLLSPTEAAADAIDQLCQTSDTAQNGQTSRSALLRIPRGATSDSNTASRTSVKKNVKCTRDRAESATATSQPSWCDRVACFCLHRNTTVGGHK